MKTKYILSFLLLTSLAMGLRGQDTVKVMHYNILRYGLDCNVDIATKTTWLKNIFTHHKPDILTVNEIAPEEAYANRIKLQALTYAPMQYAPNSNLNNSFLVNRLFYNTDKFEFVKLEGIQGSLRDIDAVTLRDKARAAAGDTLEITCLVAHLKAGSSSTDQSRRGTAATSVMSWINAKGPDFKNYLLMGDFNIGGAAEPAWRTFAFNGNTNINLQDPTGTRNGWGASTVKVLTQAPTNSRSDCGVGGAMDDRFDFILTSKAVIQNTDRIGYIPGSYEALGNDGRTPYNTELNCSGNTSVPSSICGNLKQASDHLPIVMDLMFGYPVGISQLDWATATVEIRYGSNGDSPTLFLDQSADISDVNISLFSIQGKQIWTTSKSAQAQMNVVLPIDGMPSGMYLVRVQNEKGQQKTLKVRM